MLAKIFKLDEIGTNGHSDLEKVTPAIRVRRRSSRGYLITQPKGPGTVIIQVSAIPMYQ